MRQSYLEAYNNVIPRTQQEKLLSVLKSVSDESGVATTMDDLQTQLELLIEKIRKPLGTPLIGLRKAAKYGKMVSKDYNDTMQEAYADLGALFKQNNNINRTITVHRALDTASIADARSGMRKVENDIEVYKVLKNNKSGITNAVFGNFHADDNQSTDNVYRAWCDTENHILKLPIGVDSSSISLNGIGTADISVTRYGGGISGNIESEENRKSNAIDGSEETFWAEAVLTDEPIRQSYDGENVFGQVCEVTISLFRRDLINYIRFKPFTNYPLNIIAIKYRQNSDDPWSSLVVQRQSSTGVMEFRFDEVYMKDVMIVINQENPSINTYKIPKSMINNSQLWQQIADRELSISSSTDQPIQATQDMIDYISGWQAYVDASDRFTKSIKQIGRPTNYVYDGSISETIFDSATNEMMKSAGTGAGSLKMDLYGKKPETEDGLIEVRKYEYVYGAYEIDIRKIWYVDTGEYISPKYQVGGPIIEASLEPTEVTPSGTTIEYQVSTRPDQWRNILPENSSGYIYKERVDIDPITQVGPLRFPCSGTISDAYMNDSVLPGSSYSFDGNNLYIVSGVYAMTASYTASYYPQGVNDSLPSGVRLSFSDDPLTTTQETIEGADSRQYDVTLSHFPFVDYRPINDTAEANKAVPNFYRTDGRWLNINASGVYGIDPGDYYDVMIVTVDGYSAENMTDYYNDIRPALTQYSLSSYPNFEYFHSGKKLYFNTTLDKREVRVTYSYLNDYIQLRATLRNNLRSRITSTPVLDDYTIKLRTL